MFPCASSEQFIEECLATLLLLAFSTYTCMNKTMSPTNVTQKPSAFARQTLPRFSVNMFQF